MLVHHIVIVHEVLADFEVVAFHLHLGVLDDLVHHRVLQRFVFFAHARPFHQSLDPVAAEALDYIVFHGHVETRAARIALAAGPAAQLVVDSPGLVPFRTDDMKPAKGLDLLVTPEPFLKGLALFQHDLTDGPFALPCLLFGIYQIPDLLQNCRLAVFGDVLLQFLFDLMGLFFNEGLISLEALLKCLLLLLDVLHYFGRPCVILFRRCFRVVAPSLYNGALLQSDGIPCLIHILHKIPRPIFEGLLLS